MVKRRRKQGIHKTNYLEKKKRGGGWGEGRRLAGIFQQFFGGNSESSNQEYLTQTTNKALLSIDYTFVYKAKH